VKLAELTAKVRNGGDLDQPEAAHACDGLLDGSVGIESRAEFLIALREKGESSSELAAFSGELLARGVAFPGNAHDAIDVCGTGGDRSGTFNISTAVMFVAAGAGARVVKHGNRGITSKCGGADVLVALGVNISPSPETAALALEEAGCCFLFAPLYHPAVKAVAPVRAELAARGIPSIFNLLGPLINPARPCFQLVGVYDANALDLYGRTLAALGRTCAWAVNGEGPSGARLDEVSTLGPTDVVEAEAGAIRRMRLDTAELGLPPCDADALAGGDAVANAGIISALLDGRVEGPKRDIVVLNAAAALVIARRAADLRSGMALASESLASGRAKRALETLREKTA
jgi:anthranilate phosphoribosyltransferase